MSLIFLLPAAWGQEPSKADKAKEKQERQAEKKAQLQESYDSIVAAIDRREFAIEVYQFSDRYGQTVPVSTVTNFVSVEDSLATVQLVFPGSVGGPNGLGGITSEGRVTKLEVTRTKPGVALSFQLRVFGNSLATADMFVTVGADGTATIRYSGQYGGQFSLQGYFRNLAEARIYKGMPLY